MSDKTETEAYYDAVDAIAQEFDAVAKLRKRLALAESAAREFERGPLPNLEPPRELMELLPSMTPEFSIPFEPLFDPPFEPLFDPPSARLSCDLLKHRAGVTISPRDPYSILRIDWPSPGPGADALRADGWVFGFDVWLRKDGGRISGKRQRSGRYAERLPTNRKRKRARCRANRKARRRCSPADGAHR